MYVLVSQKRLINTARWQLAENSYLVLKSEQSIKFSTKSKMLPDLFDFNKTLCYSRACNKSQTIRKKVNYKKKLNHVTFNQHTYNTPHICLLIKQKFSATYDTSRWQILVVVVSVFIFI